MSDWRAGYVGGIDYTYGNYSEIDPLKAQLAFLDAGLAVPEFATACELGYGQGVSINLNAASSAIKWYGTDFDPSQASFAQELARAAGAGAALYDEAFAEFAQRSDLPDFDFIGMHGIWSWISDENRDVIVDFVRRKLKVGGVLYASYNILPGWSAFAPVRHIMWQHASRMGSPGSNILSRADNALDFVDKLMSTNPRYGRSESGFEERLKSIRAQDRHYVAHEYFNQQWNPMHFSAIADRLAPAKLQFACSALYFDHIDGINLSDEQIALLKDIPDLGLREDVRDFMLNRQFRRDYWVKGARRLSTLEQSEELQKLRFMLLAHPSGAPVMIQTGLGEVKMDEANYVPVLDALADFKPKSLAQLDRLLKPAGMPTATLMQSILVLAGKGIVMQVQDDAAIKNAWASSERLNTHIIGKSRGSENVPYLASPVAGCGLSVNRRDQLFLLGCDEGNDTPEELAAYAWSVLRMSGQLVMKDDKPLETAEENLAELTSLAEVFLAKRLPVLKAFQIA